MINVIRPKEKVFRSYPINLESADSYLFEHEYKKEFAETTAQTIRNVRVLPNGYVSSGLGFSVRKESFNSPSTGFSPAVKQMVKSLAYSSLSIKRTRLHSALILTDDFSNGFFHWFGDVLPKLELLIDLYGFEYIKNLTLIIPHMADFAYSRSSLAAFGLKNIVFLGERESAICECLLTCSPAAPTGNYRPELMKSLRDRFRSYFASSDTADQRIFISRSEAPKRRIANEAELLPILEKNGFKRVILEKLSFPDQIRLIARTLVLIGNHGAGLTNMLFMQSGTKVIELRLNGDAENNCFYSLASALGIDYYYQLCNSTRQDENAHTADFVVDPQKLERTLHLL